MSIKETIGERLQVAAQECYVRGLYQSATWASEQLKGLEEETEGQDSKVLNENDESHLFKAGEVVGRKEIPSILIGSSLLATGQYQRCAHNLQTFVNSKTVSNLGLFLYVYSKYLAGEKRKTQASDEKPRKLELRTKSKSKNADLRDIDLEEKTINPFLKEMVQELFPRYQTNSLDGYLLYLFAIIIRDYVEQHGRSLEDIIQLEFRESTDALNPRTIFMQSLASCPWNWSCWLDLAKYIITKNVKSPTWEEICSSSINNSMDITNRQGGRVMYAFFMSHLYLEKHRGDMALPAIEKLYRIFPTSLHVLTQVGLSYYSQRFYDQAEECFVVIRNRDPYRLQHVDTFSNILYVKEKTVELSALAHEVVEIEKFSPEVCCVVGNYYSLKSNHERSIVYFQRALRLDSTCLSAWTLMGHEYMELRNTAAAVQCYRNAVNVSETDYRAWYGLGQTYEMLHLYQYAFYYFRRAAFLRPTDARMWSAVGNSLLKLGMKKEAIAIYERAVNAGDREGVATRDLARLYRDESLPSKAAELYYKYLLCNIFNREMDSELLQSNEEEEEEAGDREMMPAMLSQLVERLKLTANNHLCYVDNIEVGIATEQAEALLYLANHFKLLSEIVVAEYFCTKLLSFNGPEGDEARVLLKELRGQQQSLQASNTGAPASREKTSRPVVVNPQNSSISPLFSPWKRLSHESKSKQRNSSERESIGSTMSNQDPFDRFVNDSELLVNIGSQQERRQEEEAKMSFERTGRN